MTIRSKDQYIESHKRDYMTPEYQYASYTPPNTMYQVSNDIDDVLLNCSVHAIKLWHVIMSRIKRNPDPTKAITLELNYEIAKPYLSRNYYYSALKELVDKTLIHYTSSRGEFVVNICYANKLYRPKLDIQD